MYFSDLILYWLCASFLSLPSSLILLAIGLSYPLVFCLGFSVKAVLDKK